MLLNIVENDAFSLTSMTDAINKVEFVPNQLGAMGIFSPSPIRSKSLVIDVRAGAVKMVATTSRGEPIESRDKRRKAQLKSFQTGRVAVKDRVTADDLAFLREFGTEDQPKELGTEIALRQNQDGNGLMGDIDLTKEFMRLGAIRGKLYDTDGSTVIYDYFAEMGVTAPSILTMNMTTLTDGKFRTAVANSVVRYMENNAKGARYSKVIALCGTGAYDKLHENSEFREAHLAQVKASELLNDHRTAPTSFAGVEWVEYRGTDDGSTVDVGENEVIFIPGGIGNTVFKEVQAPGEKFSHLGQMGKAHYSWLKWDEDEDPSWVDIHVASYMLMLNTRPEMVRQATFTTS